MQKQSLILLFSLAAGIAAKAQTPTLQEVTTNGNSTNRSIIIDNGSGSGRMTLLNEQQVTKILATTTGGAAYQPLALLGTRTLIGSGGQIGTDDGWTTLQINGNFKAGTGTHYFRYNGVGDLSIRHGDRGTGGRALVHDAGNILTLNYGGDFTGGTRLGNKAFFSENGNSYLMAGNVGIGTNNPLSKLQLGAFGTSNAAYITIPGVYNFEVMKIGQGGNGRTMIEMVNHVNQTQSYGFKMGTDVDTYGNGFYICAAPIASTYESLTYNASPAFFVNTSSQVGIGTNNTAGYKLAVAGNMIAEKVKVKLQTAWPDFVFSEEYNLPALEELEKFIRMNRHLPDIPTAAEVTVQGLDIGENQAILLQKIEELTLYLIDQNKQIAIQQEQIRKQQSAIASLEERIRTLNDK